jgi:hypothetical protein
MNGKGEIEREGTFQGICTHSFPANCLSASQKYKLPSRGATWKASFDTPIDAWDRDANEKPPSRRQERARQEPGESLWSPEPLPETN